MAGPITVTNITDVGINATASLLAGEAGRVLPEPSLVKIYANQENVNVSFTVSIGGRLVADDAPAAIQATVGQMPIIPDNILVNTLGVDGDEIVIRARNVDAAASEARVIVFITPIDDAALIKAQEDLALG